MHRKITREEILCAAYAQKLGFLVIKLIICWGFLQLPDFFKKMLMNNWSWVSLVIAVLTGWGHINVYRTTKSNSYHSIYKLKRATKRTFLCWEWARHFSETFSHFCCHTSDAAPKFSSSATFCSTASSSEHSRLFLSRYQLLVNLKLPVGDLVGIWTYLLVMLSFAFKLTCWWCCNYCISEVVML